MRDRFIRKKMLTNWAAGGLRVARLARLDNCSDSGKVRHTEYDFNVRKVCSVFCYRSTMLYSCTLCSVLCALLGSDRSDVAAFSTF